ncbi:methylated-DNA--[protein]-cysteine S-methyltransferase [Lacticaseibacillus suihuaensis]
MNRIDYQTPLGPMTLAADDQGLCGAWFKDQAHYGQGVALAQATVATTPLLNRATRWLDRYFAGARPTVDVPLHPSGTAFREAVWTALQQVPYGTTVTYRDLGQALGASTSPRAVGNAVEHNPLSLFVPCHRVVAVSGDLTGYAGGLTRKVALLTLEGVAVSGHALAKG